MDDTIGCFFYGVAFIFLEFVRLIFQATQVFPVLPPLPPLGQEVERVLCQDRYQDHRLMKSQVHVVSK